MVGCPGVGLVAEFPPCGAEWLGGCHAVGGMKGEAIHFPWRRPCTWRAVRRGQCLAFDLSRPAARAVEGRHLLKDAPFSDLCRLTFEHQVDPFQPDGNCASRTGCKVTRLARVGG